MKENSLATEKISVLFLKIVLPSMVAMVIIGIQGMIDGLFLGNFVSNNALASVNLAQPFNQTTSAITMVLSIGGTAFMGRLLGAGDIKIAKTAFKTTFYALLFSSVVIILLGQCFHTQIATALGANDILLQDTALYIQITSLFMPFFLLYILFSFVNRIIGKPHLFIIGSTLSVLFNIVFNFIFIVHFEMGIVGAAIATGCSHIVGLLVNFPPVFSKKSQVNVFEGSFDFPLLLKMAYNGSSEGITSLSTAVTTLIFNLTFMHFYGETGVASFTIISYISQVATLLIFGVVDGITPIISFNYGASAYSRVKEAVSVAFVVNLCIGIFTYCVLIFRGEALITLFTSDDLELISLTYAGAKLYGLQFFFCGTNILASSYFTAIGDALKSVIISSSRGLIFIILGIFLLPNLFGIEGVWLVAPFADFVTFFIVLSLTKKAKNQLNP